MVQQLVGALACRHTARLRRAVQGVPFLCRVAAGEADRLRSIWRGRLRRYCEDYSLVQFRCLMDVFQRQIEIVALHFHQVGCGFKDTA
jgi:hypothetical protein